MGLVITKAALELFYGRQEKSIPKIAKLCGITPVEVIQELIKYEIPIRNKNYIFYKYGKPNITQPSYQKRKTRGHIQVNFGQGWVFEHRFVWEQKKGKIPKGWIVHHLNAIKDDNRIENLVAIPRNEHGTKTLQNILQARIRVLEEKMKEYEELVSAYEQVIVN